MRLPLTGIVVLPLEQAVAAPFGTMRRADAGARVIKIEWPEGNFAGSSDSAVGEQLSSSFGWLDRGKHGVVADVTDERDAALLDARLWRAVDRPWARLRHRPACGSSPSRVRGSPAAFSVR